MPSFSRLLLLLAFMSPLAGFAAVSGPQLGLQTWTCRNMTFDQVVDFAVRHQIKYLELISAHLDPNAPPAESLRKKAILDQHGLVAYSFGVNQAGLDAAANRRLFEFAKLMGMSLIIVEPPDQKAWDNLEALVKEYDIRLAIHNHGTGSVYGDPATVRKVLDSRDRRIGVCLDVGWVTAAGFDAGTIFRSYGDRVYDLHFKDKTIPVVDGKPKPTDSELGKGLVNYRGLFAAIKETKWSGVLAIETDSNDFAAAPDTFVAGATAFFRQHTAP